MKAQYARSVNARTVSILVWLGMARNIAGRVIGDVLMAFGQVLRSQVIISSMMEIRRKLILPLMAKSEKPGGSRANRTQTSGENGWLG